jgi:ferritin-like metal-binding protein YciE
LGDGLALGTVCAGFIQATLNNGAKQMSETDERLNQWLRDAHAMEVQSEQVLSGQVDRIEHYPELRARYQHHLDETVRQRKRLEECLKRRGASTSGMKDAASKFTAMMQSITGAMAGDEVVKSLMATYTFEHMEISAYRILAATASAAADAETAKICMDNCAEEEQMSAWLIEAMPEITKAFLLREESEMETAKR